MPANYFHDRLIAYNNAIDHLNPHEMMCIAVAARALRQLRSVLSAEDSYPDTLNKVIGAGEDLRAFADQCGHRFDQIQDIRRFQDNANLLQAIEGTATYIGGILKDYFEQDEPDAPVSQDPTPPCGDDCICLDLVDEEAAEEEAEEAIDDHGIIRYADLVVENQKLKKELEVAEFGVRHNAEIVEKMRVELEASRNRPNISSPNIHPIYPVLAQPHVKPLYWHGDVTQHPKIMSGGVSLAPDPTVSHN